MRFEQLDRVRLANLPTPLEELNKLSNILDGPRLLIKRDDQTGLGYGGNKLRKLEYLMGDALAKGADTIVTSGAAQTNHGRLTAAAAAKLGLKCILVITEEQPQDCEGNLLLQGLFGAEPKYVSLESCVPADQQAKAYLQAGDRKIAEVVEALRKEGRKPYVIPRGGRSLQGTAGYIMGTMELYYQMLQRGIKADHIVLPVATCSTMTGLLLGTRILSMNTKVYGISVSRSVEEGKKMVEEEFNRDSHSLGYSYTISQEDIHIDGTYLGEGYGCPTQEAYEAINLLAKEEGVLLDPVYTGKAMAGLLDLIQKGRFKKDETVVFMHTGGGPLLFLDKYADLNKLRSRSGGEDI